MIVGEFSGALNPYVPPPPTPTPCPFFPPSLKRKTLRSEEQGEADEDSLIGRVGDGTWWDDRGSMGGSTGGEADEKTRQFVRAQLEVRFLLSPFAPFVSPLSLSFEGALTFPPFLSRGDLGAYVGV